jgi:hypothetical protein
VERGHQLLELSLRQPVDALIDVLEHRHDVVAVLGQHIDENLLRSSVESIGAPHEPAEPLGRLRVPGDLRQQLRVLHKRGGQLAAAVDQPLDGVLRRRWDILRQQRTDITGLALRHALDHDPLHDGPLVQRLLRDQWHSHEQ